MSDDRYPVEPTTEDYRSDLPMDCGVMPNNVSLLSEHVVGRRIVSVDAVKNESPRYGQGDTLVITLDNGKRVKMADQYDCCAYTQFQEFFLDPQAVDHLILGVGTTGGYTTWHIYADFGDIMRLKVDWSCGNPFYYAYGFHITVDEVAS